MTTPAPESRQEASELTIHYRRARTWFEFASGTRLLTSGLGIRIGHQPIIDYDVEAAPPQSVGAGFS